MDILIFLFLAIFPFGQILRIGILSPLDVVVGVAAVYSIIKKQEVPEFFRYLRPFLFVAGFSWFFSIFLFHQINVLYGLLYLVRLAAYFYFGVYVWNFVKRRKGNKKLLLDSLLSVSAVSAIFGWIQYFNFPALKPFMVWGWDEHLYRLVGTFLDPTFLGLIVVFGLILSIYRCIDSWNLKNALFTVFLLISLAFTYSRASYLALFAVVVSIGLSQKKFRKYLYVIFAFLILVFILPTSGNHVLSFTRTFSAIARVENYQSTLKIFSKFPVFGVGYDNLCLSKSEQAGYIDFQSHSCSGSDSSILFILATTGVTGLMIFVFSVWKVIRSLPKNKNFLILISSFLALFVHSLFSNSMFYPWIMGWIMILLAEV
jgi:hypothetical protein